MYRARWETCERAYKNAASSGAQGHSSCIAASLVGCFVQKAVARAILRDSGGDLTETLLEPSVGLADLAVVPAPLEVVS